MSELDPDTVQRATEEIEASMARHRAALLNTTQDAWWEDWLVTVPPCNQEGVKIERFEVSREEENVSMLRAAFNPQRSDRSVRAGTYTRLEVDGTLWMTDTPAEVVDHLEVDEQMLYADSMLIVGLGIGMVLQRAIVHQMIQHIDVVDTSGRILRAVQPHYEQMAKDHGCEVVFHHSGIHEWRAPRDSWWDVGWFDIWASIDTDDMPEVKRLRDRFRTRLGWFGAWAQNERIAANRRVRLGTGLY